VSEAWDDQFERLSKTRGMYHNEDYWQFLVREVWRLDHALVRLGDFGCGYGWAGLFLLPLLASGSDYTGIDRSGPLLEEGRGLFARLGRPPGSSVATSTRRPSPTTSSTSPSPIR
jgi:SAM-dependent methyltransferase